MSILLSVIIPVYKVERLLPRCLNSVINQWDDYKEKIEIVLIDDGSPDDSGKICDEYALKYSNIMCIHKENGGLSEARNVGIKKAVGKYLLFLDSDDQINKNTIEILLNNINNNPDAEVFIGTYLEIINGKINKNKYELDEKKGSGDEIFKYLLNGFNRYDWFAWLNIIQKDYLDRNNFYFENGKYYEDILWTPNIIYNAKNVCLINYPIYIYTRNRKDAITTTKSIRIFDDKIYVCNYIISLKDKLGLEPETTEKLIGGLCLIYTSLLSDIWEVKYNNRKKYWKKLNELSMILKYSSRKIDSFMNIIAKVLGIKVVSYCLYKRKKRLENRRKE